MRNTQSSLAVDVRPDGATVVVRLDGELDITSSPLLQTVVEQVLAARRQPLCTHLVVDMSGVGFADASGVSPLLLAPRRAGSPQRPHRAPALPPGRAAAGPAAGPEDMLASEEPPVG